MQYDFKPYNVQAYENGVCDFLLGCDLSKHNPWIRKETLPEKFWYEFYVNAVSWRRGFINARKISLGD